MYSVRPFNEHPSRNAVFLFGSKKLLTQPFSYGLIIQFQTQASQNDTQNKNTHSYIPSFSQCIKFILNQPCVEQIHQRIMYYINRIGYISQELAYLCRLLIRSSTRRPQPHKKRKNRNYTKSFINTIHANRLQSFQIRNREQRNQYNSTYPKCPFTFIGLKLRDINIPNENGKSIRKVPPKKFTPSSVHPTPIFP